MRDVRKEDEEGRKKGIAKPEKVRKELRKEVWIIEV